MNIAKKYHPDAIQEDQKETNKDLFKEITEAYSVLGDTEKRAKYDQLIFGDSAKGNFSNQEAYEYWKERTPGQNIRKDQYQKQEEKIREKLKNYKDYNDFLKRMENHREKHSAREHLFRGEGFKDLNSKYGPEYNYFEEAEYENQEKYYQYRERYYESYWDTKENHEYYSQPVSTRAWIQLKKVILFHYDLAIVWGALGLVFIIYNAHTTALKTNVSHAYLQIWKQKSLEPLNRGSHLENKYTEDDFKHKRAINNENIDLSKEPSK